MTQSARVILLANGGGSNLRAAWQVNPAATWASAPTAHTPTYSNGSSSVWNRVAYSPDANIIVALHNNTGNNNNQIMVSGDGGDNWLAVTNPDQSTFIFTDICYAPGLKLFVACANAGPTTTARICTSPDGFNWTERSLPDATKALVAIACGTISGNDYLVAVGTNMIYTSTDGITWTAQTSPSNQSWSGIVWNSGQSAFVACANSGGGTNNIMSSTDGTSWSLHSTGGSGYSWTRIAYSASLDQMIVIGGNTGVICYSTAGSLSSWTQFSTGLGSSAFTGITWCDDQSVWVMVNDATSTAIYTCSTCSGTWTAQTNPSAINWGTVLAIPSSTKQSYCIGLDSDESGHNYVGTASGTSSTAPTIAVTTYQKNGLLVMIVGTERLYAAGAYNNVTSISGGSGVSWTQQKQYQWRGGRNGSSPYNYNNLEVWTAPVTALQSAVTFTVNLSAASDNVQLTCLNVVGADAAPLDTNAANGATNNAGTSQSASYASVSGVSTDSTKPFMLCIEASSRAISGSTAPTGFTEIFHGGAASGTDWENFGLSYARDPNAGSAYSSATITTATTQVISWGIMALALKAPATAASTGTFAVTEDVDVFAGTAVIDHNGTWSSSEAVDVSSMTGVPGSYGTWASTEDADILDATGVLTDFGGIVAGFDAHEDPDVFAADGEVTIVATWASTEAPDVFHAFGKITIVGTLAPTEAKDVLAGIGWVAGQTGVWASNEPVDRIYATGKVPRVGTWASTEISDTATIVGLGSTGFQARRIFFVT